MKHSASSHLVKDIMRPEKERRSTFGRVRRFVVSCVTDTNIDTLSIVVFWCQFGLIVALFILQERIIKVPPPFFENFIVRLPAVAWSMLVVLGMLTQIYGWARADICKQRNGAVFSAGLIFLMCGPIFLQAPAFSIAVFLVNMWQAVIAARLIGDCDDDD